MLAGYGGGIYVKAGTVTLDAVTVSGSKAAYGGGIYNSGTLEIQNTTVSNNTATLASASVSCSGSRRGWDLQFRHFNNTKYNSNQ